MQYYFNCSNALLARVSSILYRVSNDGKLQDSVAQDLSIEDLVVLDQLIPLLEKYEYKPPKDLYEYFIFRSYVYLQWLITMGLDISLKVSEVSELIDIMQEFAYAQEKFEIEIKKFNESREQSKVKKE